MKEDFKILEINNWQAVSQNRTEWRHMVYIVNTVWVELFLQTNIIHTEMQIG